MHSSLRSLPWVAALALLALSSCGDDTPDRVRVTFALAGAEAPLTEIVGVVHYPSSVIVSQLPFSDACRPLQTVDAATFVDRGDGTIDVELLNAEGIPCTSVDEDSGECDDFDDDAVARRATPNEQPDLALAMFSLLDCTFDIVDSFDAGDFFGHVTSANTVDGEAASPLPAIVVTDIDTFGRDDNDDDDPEATSFEVTALVTTAVGQLGALQFNIIHHGEGGFAGGRDTTRCRSLIPTALASFNDVGNGVLRAGIIDVQGFPTPGPVASCTFKSREDVAAEDFEVVVIDATNPELEKRNAEMAVSVERLDQ